VAIHTIDEAWGGLRLAGWRAVPCPPPPNPCPMSPDPARQAVEACFAAGARAGQLWRWRADGLCRALYPPPQPVPPTTTRCTPTPRQAVEACFAARSPEAALHGFYDENVRALAHLTALVRGQLSSLERKVGAMRGAPARMHA
jgi:hypothetical protein